VTGDSTESTRRTRRRTSGPSAGDAPPELARLPKGRHGLPREFIARNHRERLIAGLAEAVAKKGYAKTTITDITREAAVSRRTFYEHFESKEECFLAAYDVVMERITELLKATAEAESQWPMGIRAALGALLDFFSREPALARLTMVEGALAGPRILDRYRRLIDALIEVLRLGRDEAEATGTQLPPTTEETLAGGIASLVCRRILTGEAEQLDQLLPEVVVIALTPYLGASAAERVALSSG
jgi:AcrR family transcriptional regulator